MNGMDKERQNQGGAGVAAYSIVTVLVVLPILYVFNSGPVLLIFKLTGWPRQMWENIYSPAMNIAIFVNLGNALARYINLWTA